MCTYTYVPSIWRVGFFYKIVIKMNNYCDGYTIVIFVDHYVMLIELWPSDPEVVLDDVAFVW